MDLRLDPFLSDKTLVFTVTSDGYKDYTWNLWKWLEKIGVPWKLCVLCLDRESYAFFQRIAAIPCRLFLLPGQRLEHKTPAIFGSTTFKRMNRQKLLALEQLSQRPDIEKLIFVDSDIAIFRDPLPYLKERLQEHALWFQCDEKNEEFVCTANESTPCYNPCTGVIAMRLDQQSRPLFKKLYALQEEPWKQATTDQDYIANQLLALSLPYKILDRALFPNGIFIAGQRYKEGNPFLLHFNYIIGSEKKRMMKARECWLLHV